MEGYFNVYVKALLTFNHILTIITVMVQDKMLPQTVVASDSVATTGTATAGQLIDASLSANTRDCYQRALRQLHAYLAGAEATDASVAAYLGHLFERGYAAATAAMVVAAIACYCKHAAIASPVGPLTRAALSGYRRRASNRGRGQARPCTAANVAAILATATFPRQSKAGVESAAVAARRGALDRAIAAVLFQGALRRSEAAALTWGDIEPASTPGALLIHVQLSKTNQEGHDADLRYLKNGCAAALTAIRPDDPDDQEPVFALSPASISRRFSAAASAAGIEHRLTAHSGRVGLASELTARGASTTEVMRAGAWKTARMVAHYSAGATAERGAVAKYL